jgi:hypothetical protein
MSRPRKLGVTIALVLAPVVLVSAIGVGWFFASLPNVGDFFDYGYLGPPERRQRTELAEHGFAIAFADDWVVEEQAGDSAEAKRVGMREVLTARSAGEVPRCTVNVVLAEEAGTAEDVLRVWAPADARQADYGTYRGQDVPEGVVGTAFCDMAGSWRADWYVPLTDDAVLFTCVLLNEACPDADVELSGLVMWGMLPIVRSIEPLAAPSPPATDTALGQGRRVGTPPTRRQ